jgi:sec-independent protein translocase protein TatB
MFGIGMQELLLILVIALIVLGPKKLPDVAKALGKAMNEFKRATSDLKESLDVDQSLNSVKKSFDAMNDPKPAADAAVSDPKPSSEVKPPSPSPEETAPKPPEPPRAAS